MCKLAALLDGGGFSMCIRSWLLTRPSQLAWSRLPSCPSRAELHVRCHRAVIALGQAGARERDPPSQLGLAALSGTGVWARRGTNSTETFVRPCVVFSSLPLAFNTSLRSLCLARAPPASVSLTFVPTLSLAPSLASAIQL
eukprot:6212724-Pleurochrysis_carterae.AAC.1